MKKLNWQTLLIVILMAVSGVVYYLQVVVFQSPRDTFFCLTEELASRENPQALGGKDADHIAGDLKRAYVLLMAAWLAYMKHLRDEYPYLFSFAMRTNPFNPSASPEIS